MLHGLCPGSRVLVDSSALIYLVEAVPRRGEAVSAFLEELRVAGGRPFASALVMIELLSGALRRGDADLAQRYRSFLADSSRIVLVPVDAEVSEEAARILASCGPGNKAPARGLSLADAVHIATALVHDACAVLTNDEAWREVPGAPEVFLVDEIAKEDE
jgi:predicted nucleic acid-binding protein